MLWQDIVITIASAVFSISLVPQVYYGFKQKKGLVALSTSIPTFLGLLAIAFSFLTLHLYLSSLL